MDGYHEPTPFLWIEDGKGQTSTPRMRKKIKKKREYVRWGSRELIEFLESIGKDTTNALSQYDVTNIINLYINDNKLVHPENKRRAVCDEKLQPLFGNKKTFFRNKVHDLLESHLLENQNASDDDDFGSSDENGDDEFSVTKKLMGISSIKKIQPKKKDPEVSKSCLVAINSQNIKLVYLRRSMVLELLSNPETFESKLIGSFVRVKADPHDIFQKNSHQLQLVTGAVVGDTRSSKCLQISGMMEDISISELSDDSFSEEEIEDLRQRVKDGLLKQPTVGELEQKVVALHELITKDWIARELKFFKNIIDRANEKGWRHRVAEYLDKKKLLESSAEQARLLSEIPKVMPEEVKPVTVEPVTVEPETMSDDDFDDSPKASDWDREPSIFSSNEVVTTKPEVLSKPDGQEAETSTRSNGGEAHPFNSEERNQPGTDNSIAVNNGHAQSVEPKEGEAPREEATRLESNGHIESLNLDDVSIPSPEISQERNGHLQLPSSKESEKTPVVVIDLSDDDDEEQGTPGGGTQIPRPYPEQIGSSGAGTQNPGTRTQILVGGSQIPRPYPEQIGSSGTGTQNPGTRTQILGAGSQILRPYPEQIGSSGAGTQNPGSRTQILGGGSQIPGTHHSNQLGTSAVGTPIPVFGTQILNGGNPIPGTHPEQLVQHNLIPQNRGGNQILGPHPELLVWHYFDPQGRVQGPFSLSSLKRWNDARYFPYDFKVWMSGQNPQQAVQLNLVLHQIFPN